MIDAVLYGIDRRGRLILRERAFESLAQLALFFGSDRADPWSWVEIDGPGRRDVPTHRRYSADSLRGSSETWRLLGTCRARGE